MGMEARWILRKTWLNVPTEGTMRSCKQCGTEIQGAFRFCPWCGHVQRLKVTEFFFGHAGLEAGSRRALRISRYFGEEADERHVRFSVWSEVAAGETRVEAAVSLDEVEADLVARFLATSDELSEAETL
jgi:hypothetical protein